MDSLMAAASLHHRDLTIAVQASTVQLAVQLLMHITKLAFILVSRLLASMLK